MARPPNASGGFEMASSPASPVPAIHLKRGDCRIRSLCCRFVRLVILAGICIACAQDTPPEPDHADVRYGPHERNVLMCGWPKARRRRPW